MSVIKVEQISFRPPSPYCKAESQTEEELDRRQLPVPSADGLRRSSLIMGVHPGCLVCSIVAASLVAVETDVGECPRYDITMLLKDTTKQQVFKTVLLNKFQVLDELLEEETINEKWQTIKESLTPTCKEVLGPKEQHHKEWISAETLKKIEERKRKKGRNQ